jgi:hypothetical protein
MPMKEKRDIRDAENGDAYRELLNQFCKEIIDQQQIKGKHYFPEKEKVEMQFMPPRLVGYLLHLTLVKMENQKQKG